MPVLTDFAAVLRRPAFWSSYYGGRVADTEDETGGAFLTRVLGDDPDFDHDGLWGPDPYEVITDEMDDDEEDEAMEAAMAAGALFLIPFPSGHSWSIRFSSSPGVFHGLSTPDGAERISLGYDDPHFHLPILRWAEAHRIAACLARSGESGGAAALPAEFVLPLLAPVTWATSAAEAADAERSLAAAWAATGMVGPTDAAELAGRMVLHVSDFVWRPDPVHGWTNNGRHSHRNPLAGSWSPEHFAVFRGFLDSLHAVDETTHALSGRGPGTASDAAHANVTTRWRYDTDGPVDPVVTLHGDQVYCFTSADAKLRALDAATGRERWYTGVLSRGSGRNAVAVSDGTILYAGGSGRLDLVAFAEHASGEAGIAWVHGIDPDRTRYAPSGAYCGWADTTPAVADGRVFVAEEQLYAWQLTPSGPQLAWSERLPGVSTPRSRPVVTGGRVYVLVGEDHRNVGTVRGFGVATGKHVRHGEIEVAGPVQDLAAHGDTLFVAADALTALDAETGTVRWTVGTERQWSGVIGVTDDWVVGTTCRLPPTTRTVGPEWQCTMVGVDRNRREVAWTFTAPGRLASRGVVVDGGTAYTVGYDDHDATLYAVDLTSGALRWEYPLGRSTCLPAAADGTVYVSTAEGALLALREGHPQPLPEDGVGVD